MEKVRRVTTKKADDISGKEWVEIINKSSRFPDCFIYHAYIHDGEIYIEQIKDIGIIDLIIIKIKKLINK